jgi:hypothetical protein
LLPYIVIVRLTLLINDDLMFACIINYMFITLATIIVKRVWVTR